MRVFTLTFLALSLITPRLGADSLKKPCLAATHPGSWAKYESRWKMPNGTAGANLYMYIRCRN